MHHLTATSLAYRMGATRCLQSFKESMTWPFERPCWRDTGYDCGGYERAMVLSEMVRLQLCGGCATVRIRPNQALQSSAALPVRVLSPIRGPISSILIAVPALPIRIAVIVVIMPAVSHDPPVGDAHIQRSE